MATQIKSNRRIGRDTYMEMVARFPLRPLKNDKQHEQATGIAQELLGRDLDSGTSDYLDTLILLINKYEDENHTPRGMSLSPREALRAIMNANGLSQAEMGKIIGSESAVSMFLSGKRNLSKTAIKAISARFRVDASLFL